MIKPEYKETKLNEDISIQEYIENRQKEIDSYINTKKETLKNIEKLEEIAKELIKISNNHEDVFEQFIEELTEVYKKYNIVNSPTLSGTIEQYLYYVSIF